MPEGVASLDAAAECVQLAERYGPGRDDAQKITLQAWMGIQDDGKWAAALAAHAMSRQNGKGDELQDREAYGLLILGEVIVHTAHEVATANNAFERMEAFFQHRDLRSKVAKVRYANGEKGIELKSGALIAYRARTGAAGRGLDAIDLVVYDEGQHLQAEHMAASSPALAVSPNPQVIVTGSAGLAHSVRWWEMRMDALRDVGGRFAYVEHGAEDVSLNAKGELVSMSPDPALEQTWADANPAYGSRIPREFLVSQRRVLGDHLFLREHCGVWDPLPAVVQRAAVFDPDGWQAAEDLESVVSGAVVLSVDVAPGSTSAAVSFCGQRPDGALHVEMVECATGTGWLADRLDRAFAGSKSKLLGVEPSGPVSSVMPELQAIAARHGAKMVALPGSAYAGGCEGFVAGIAGKTIRHKGQAWLSTSAGAAGKRKHGEQWVWDRDAGHDVTPLVAATVAVRVWQQERPKTSSSSAPRRVR